MKSMVLVLLLSSTALAAETRGRWLRDHFIVEILGAGGWRTSIAPTDRKPGFEELAGGGELALGLDVWGPLGVVVLGRFIIGDNFYEGSGAIALHIRVSDRVRLRVGPSAGELKLGRERAPLVGGLLAATIDLIPFGHGRVATSLGVRLDMDGTIGGETLPAASIALAIGLGFRY